MIPILAAVMIASAPAQAAPTVQDLAGMYRLSQIEMGGALQLQADGRFRYVLDYGAVSEAAEGRWTLDSAGVHLHSDAIKPEDLRQMERSDAALQDELLRIEGNRLVMERYEARMIFQRVKP